MHNIITTAFTFKKPTVWMLLILNVVMAGAYTYAVNRTVFNVVAATKAEKALAQASADIADLESRYISLKNKITLDFAYSQGFKDASNKQVFVTKKPVGNTLSFNAL